MPVTLLLAVCSKCHGKEHQFEIEFNPMARTPALAEFAKHLHDRHGLDPQDAMAVASKTLRNAPPRDKEPEGNGAPDPADPKNEALVRAENRKALAADLIKQAVDLRLLPPPQPALTVAVPGAEFHDVRVQAQTTEETEDEVIVRATATVHGAIVDTTAPPAPADPPLKDKPMYDKAAFAKATPCAKCGRKAVSPSQHREDCPVRMKAAEARDKKIRTGQAKKAKAKKKPRAKGDELRTDGSLRLRPHKTKAPATSGTATVPNVAAPRGRLEGTAPAQSTLTVTTPGADLLEMVRAARARIVALKAQVRTEEEALRQAAAELKKFFHA